MRILVADCEPSVRFALRTLLNQCPGLEVVGEAVSAGELVAQVEATRPDLVLLHWRLQETAPDLLPTLKKICTDLYMIVLSARPEVSPQALASGADAFVCKVDSPDKLLAAVERARSCPGPGRGLALQAQLDLVTKGAT